jgi:hypothetical protein
MARPFQAQTYPQLLVEHHLRARYFTAGATFNPWTLLPASTVASIQQNAKVTLGAAARAFVFGVDKVRAD